MVTNTKSSVISQYINEKNHIFYKKTVDKPKKVCYNGEVVNGRGWRNRQTRTFEGRVVHTLRVQVSSLAPSEYSGMV